MDALDKLEKKLAEYKSKYSRPNPEKQPKGPLFIMAEIVAGVCVGGFLGYYLDKLLHTKVICLIIFMILGLISAFYNIYKKYK